jgi:DNA repair protein RecN (Recombination protein N)
MLKSLSVSNYALITSLEIEFREGLNMITGETGAGKSILLGALGLILGNRADSQVLKDKSRKCMIEAGFEVRGSGFGGFFEANDLDYDTTVIVRREITPQGKSRAFINDTPVNLNLLRDLGLMLVDIHSQHQNLMLNNPGYALHVIDQFGGLLSQAADYTSGYQALKGLDKKIEVLTDGLARSRADQDYLEFQFSQLDQAALSAGELETLEEEQELLEHAGDIQLRLTESVQILHESEDAIETRLKQVVTGLQCVSGYLHSLSEPIERLHSVYLEVQETARELSGLLDHVESNPARLSVIIERIDLINNLLRKHHVITVPELIELRDQYSLKLLGIQVSDDDLHRVLAERKVLYAEISEKANKLTDARKNVWPDFEDKVTALARDLGMPNAIFKVEHRQSSELLADGRDEIRFMFAANKNQLPEELIRVASGGETSRLMLSIKSLISDSLAVPTVIFDEIDAGVSGDIADKVGNLMVRISSGRQILNITHLPQVASKGDHHYLVYKFDDDHSTHTSIRLLDHEERIMELAKMLSGERITQEAIQNARVLLKK